MTQPITRRSALALTSAAILTGCVDNKGVSSPLAAQSLETSPGEWSEGVSLPYAAQEIYPCAHQGALHLAGGFVAENGRISGPTSGHHAWQPGISSWRQGPDLQTPHHHPQLISWQDNLFAFAGFESQSSQAAWVMQKTGYRLLGHVFAPDGPAITVVPTWVDAPELPAPCGEAVAAVTGDDALHLAGGRTPQGEANATWNDHRDTDHHFVLTDLNGQWQSAAPCLSKRNSAAGDVIDGNLHIVGGRTVSGGNVAAHEVYDWREDKWRTAAPLPQAQGGLAAAAVGGKLYAFGGEYFNNGGGVYPQSWVYDPTTDAWSALPDMPTPRHGLGAVALDGKIYVIGGATSAGGNGTSALVEVFTPA